MKRTLLAIAALLFYGCPWFDTGHWYGKSQAWAFVPGRPGLPSDQTLPLPTLSTLYVNGGAVQDGDCSAAYPCHSIQRAVNLAHNGECDRIVVSRNYQSSQVLIPNGLPSGYAYQPYVENVIINKNCLMLESKGNPSNGPIVIETPGVALTIEASDVTIRGFSLYTDDPDGIAVLVQPQAWPDGFNRDVMNTTLEDTNTGGNTMLDAMNGGIGYTTFNRVNFSSMVGVIPNKGKGGIGCRNQGTPADIANGNNFFVYNTTLSHVTFSQEPGGPDEWQDPVSPCNVENWVEDADSYHLDPDKANYIAFGNGGGNGGIAISAKFAVTGPLTWITGNCGSKACLGAAHVVTRYASYANTMVGSVPAATIIPAATATVVATPTATPTPLVVSGPDRYTIYRSRN